jgi:hypothetical protein
MVGVPLSTAVIHVRGASVLEQQARDGLACPQVIVPPLHIAGHAH